MTSVFSCQNSISLCPASFHIPRPNLPVTPGVSWLPTCAFQYEAPTQMQRSLPLFSPLKHSLALRSAGGQSGQNRLRWNLYTAWASPWLEHVLVLMGRGPWCVSRGHDWGHGLLSHSLEAVPGEGPLFSFRDRYIIQYQGWGPIGGCTNKWGLFASRISLYAPV